MLLLVLSVNQALTQLKFTQEERLVFVGSDSIENNRIIASVYIFPKDSSHLTLEIEILHNWKVKEKIVDSVTLDFQSLSGQDVYLTLQSDTLPAYRFFNNEGLEIIIAKEQFFEISPKNRAKGVKPYSLSIAQIILPKNKKYYVNELPLMYYK
jgi:hypothetical protein